LKSADYLVLESTRGTGNNAWMYEKLRKLFTGQRPGGTLVYCRHRPDSGIVVSLRGLEEARAIPQLPVYIDSPMAIRLCTSATHSARLFP
jgi:hypothetical protein